MGERKPLPTRPEDIRIPKLLDKISRKKGKDYRKGKTKRWVVDFGIGGAMRIVTYPGEVWARAKVRKRHGKPTIYHAERVGRNGEIFTIPKIRTMENGADKHGSRYAQGNRFSDHEDPRVTEVGRELRELDADELRQLKLVRKGIMSLVDSRAFEPADEAILEEKLGEERAANRRQKRSEGKPGLIHLPAVFDRERIRNGDESLGVEWDEWFWDNDTFGLDVYVTYIVVMQRINMLLGKLHSQK